MLPDPSFAPGAIQGVPDGESPTPGNMGDYYPQTTFCSKAQFELDRCGVA